MHHNPYMGENGKRTLKKDKAVAIYDLIQSNREECEIERIIQRAVEGDYNALNQANGIYTDITGAPESIAQAQQWIIDIKNKWNELPSEIKAKFNNNVEEYTAQFGTEKWADKVGYTEALQKEEAERAANIKMDTDYKQAVINIASGLASNNEKGGEVNGN